MNRTTPTELLQIDQHQSKCVEIAIKGRSWEMTGDRKS